MTEFVSIPASIFWVTVGFIIVLLAFNAYFIHKWDIAIQEIEKLEKDVEDADETWHRMNEAGMF